MGTVILSKVYNFRLKKYVKPNDSIDLGNKSFHGALVAVDIVAAYYNKLYRHSPAVISKERILLLPIVIYLRKHSCLRSRMNRHVEKLVSSGILEYWIDRYKDTKYTKIHASRNLQHLNLSQLEGIFFICCVSYCLAFYILLMEIFWSRLMH